MRKYIFLLLCLCVLPLFGEVSVISVTDTDKHSTKKDFYHTFEYFISAEGLQGSKCQATRFAPHWFATAAHCVEKLCADTCTLRMDLLDTPVSVFAQAQHTAKNPRVFIHPGYKSSQLAKDDFALIRLDFNRDEKIYYRRANAKNPNNIALDTAQFNAWMSRNPRSYSQYLKVLSPSLPPIAVFDNGNYILDRTLSVISIFDGKRAIKINSHPVYYLKDLGYAFTNNFGIQKGMSGSGVMTNTGELVGIISSYVWADYYRGKKKTHQDYFTFPVFNESLVSFMRDVMGSDFSRVEQKDAYPYLVQKTHRNFSEIISLFKSQKPD